MFQVSTLAGSSARGSDDGTGTSAKFHSPAGIAVGEDGDIFLADSNNHMIRKISATSGEVTTLAGKSTPSFADGQGTMAQFNSPNDLAVMKEGWVVVADVNNNCIRTITPKGKVTTLAGQAAGGYVDGLNSNARFNSPQGIAIDHDGNIIVADAGNNRIRLVTPAGMVSTLAGSGVAGFMDADGISAQFNSPRSVAVNRDGFVIVADSNNHRIRKISPEGKVSTIAGNGPGHRDGVGSIALFHNPIGLTFDGDDNIVVADQGNHRIRMISFDGQVTTIAGSGNGSYQDGVSTSAQFNHPRGVAVDEHGDIIVADLMNMRIRKIYAELIPPKNGLPALLPSTHETEMIAMLEDPTFADVVFQVGKTKITAHKNVLASRCEYFKVMFSSAFKEGGSLGGASAASLASVTVGDTTPSAFKALLQYLYTDVFKFKDRDVLSVMRKAKEYSLDRLYNHIVRYCCRHICEDNVVIWLIQADEFGLEELRASALRYLARNFVSVRNKGGLLSDLQEKPALIMEVMLAIKV
jgi:sugar lactone lactonase YvrE